ncbi:MAG: HAMP domain-containing protein [Deltaproteobacteria bacterium]|nr:HAMP domain-containing protein [Deltaproteobacteria bacterium]
MSVRTKIAAVLCAILAGAIALTGYLVVREARRYSSSQISAQQQLYVEARAQTFGDNLRVLADELRRLSRRAEVDLADNDVRPEAQLLSAAHQNSVLYNIGILILAADGRIVHTEPPQQARPGQEIDDILALLRGGRGSVLHVFQRPDEGTVLAIAVPVRARGTLAGAIVGEVALARANLFSHLMASAKGEPTAQVALVDSRGAALHGPKDVGTDPEWTAVLALAAGARRPAAVHRRLGAGPETLFAYAPVGVGQLTLVYRWSFVELDSEMARLIGLLWRILAAGLAVALTLAVVFARYLTRPLKELDTVARRIGEGDFPDVKPSTRRDEIGALYRAFAHMEQSLRSRDERIRDDIEEIRRIAAERERLLGEVEALASSLEQRVRDRTAELQAAQQRLVASERFAAMGKAAAAMAHELKNSLGGISMSVDLILQQNPGGSMRVRHQLNDEIVRLREVTDSLLDFAREPRLDIGERDLNRLVRRAADMLSEILADQGARLRLELHADGAPFPFRCDGAKLEGVVINLLKNAAEAVGRTGSPGEVRVRTRLTDGTAVIEVEDDGAGVAGAVRGHLFEPFFSTKPSGTGLGLATAHRLVEAHGGRIEALSAPGGGGLFRITLLPQAAGPSPEEH